MASDLPPISKELEEVSLNKCDPCKYQKIIVEGKAHCLTCNENLCQRCEQAHRGSKATRNHVIKTENDIHSDSMRTKPTQPVECCDTHKSMTINIYCQDHDEVICGTCKITDHRRCVTTDVTDHMKHIDITKHLDEVVTSLDDLKHEYEILYETRRTDQIIVERQISKCLEDMKNVYKQINQTLKRLQRKFEKEVKETEKRINKANVDNVAIAEDALLQISEQIKCLGELRKSKMCDVMFIGTKKADKLRRKYNQTLSRVQQTIYPIQIRFRANNAILDVIEHVKSIGTIDEHKQPPTRRTAITNMSVVDKRDIDICMRGVSNCTFMNSGHLVLLGGSTGIVVLDENFKVQPLKISDNSYGIAAINENEVVVTHGGDQKLQRVRLFPELVIMPTVKMDRDCFGVDVFKGEIYVACNDGKGLGEVQVLNMDGEIQRKLGVNNGEYLFKLTNDVKVSLDGSKIFVSDVGTHKVTCLNQQDDVIYEYSDPDLKFPLGLYLDADDTLLVCGSNSNNIHMVGRDGRKVKVLLTKKDGVVDPMCVSYRQSDRYLVVGLWRNDKPLIVYDTKFIQM